MALSDDQVSAFLDAAPDAMVIVDQQGNIAFVNNATEAMFRYGAAELIGKPIETLLPVRFRERHREHLARYREAPRRRPMGANLDLFGQRADGSEFAVEISLSPVSTGNGNFVSCAIRDVSDRREVEQALIAAREFAEQANRAKSAFLAAASHDLRQPLQTLTLLSSVLTRAVPTDSRAGVAVANQTDALRLMGELLNSLLDISKLEAGVVRPDITDVSVERIFKRLRAEFAAVAEAKGLAFIVGDCDTSVRTDATLLSQIIQNLIGNAIRYTREGWVSLRCLAESRTVRIEVLDTGIGIPAEELALIFDEFYQARDRGAEHTREGVGLGLAIARRTADLLGCRLDVASTPGQGSRFSLTVPRSQVQPQTETPEHTEPEGFAPLPERAVVLIVDDDQAVADATAMLLGSLHLECVVSSGIRAACEALEGHRERPSLLICDFRLGHGETGVDAIIALRERIGRQIPAILVSGDTSSNVSEAARSIDACHLFSKPVDADELLALTVSLLRDAHGHRKSANASSDAHGRP